MATGFLIAILFRPNLSEYRICKEKALLQYIHAKISFCFFKSQRAWFLCGRTRRNVLPAKNTWLPNAYSAKMHQNTYFETFPSFNVSDNTSNFPEVMIYTVFCLSGFAFERKLLTHGTIKEMCMLKCAAFWTSSWRAAATT